MPARDPTPRFLAAGFGLGGLGYMMTHPEPSAEGVLIGFACLILCTGFSATAGSKTAAPSTPARSPPPAAELPEAPLVAGPQPHRLLLMEVPQGASRLPEAPTRRERSADR
ncbi:hypothetical protein ACRAWG_20505 [Methylobacterium sp. P31]